MYETDDQNGFVTRENERKSCSEYLFKKNYLKD